VDDGSTDRSGGICDAYAVKDQRFRVIHQKNRGQPGARNVGMEAVKGKYVAFIDSDDWIDREYLNFLVHKAEAEKLDMVMCHAAAEYPNGKSMELERMDIGEKTAKGTEVSFFKLYSYNSGYSRIKYGFFNTPWGKLYKMETIKKHKLRFNIEAKMIEDQLFQSEFLEYAGSIGIYKRIMYHYRMSEASAAHRFRKGYLEEAAVYLEQNRQLIDKYHREEDLYIKRYYNLVCSILILVMKCYFFHPDYSGNGRKRRKELKSLLLTEPYKSAIIKNESRTLKNNETRVIVKLLRLKIFGVLSIYFKARPSLKRVFVFIRGKKHDG